MIIDYKLLWHGGLKFSMKSESWVITHADKRKNKHADTPVCIWCAVDSMQSINGVWYKAKIYLKTDKK